MHEKVANIARRLFAGQRRFTFTMSIEVDGVDTEVDVVAEREHGEDEYELRVVSVKGNDGRELVGSLPPDVTEKIEDTAYATAESDDAALDRYIDTEIDAAIERRLGKRIASQLSDRVVDKEAVAFVDNFLVNGWDRLGWAFIAESGLREDVLVEMIRRHVECKELALTSEGPIPGSASAEWISMLGWEK